jgi:type II restriction enzyme
MLLHCDLALAEGYKSPSQKARVLTEAWCTRELYCAACDSDHILQAPPNTQAIDFRCPQCEQPYQLKGGSSWNQQRIVDAAYSSMMAAIRQDRTPNLLVMQYSPGWQVHNLMLIPRFFFTESAIERRKPLSKTARRAGWVGCNILLTHIPPDGRISMVSDGRPVASTRVRRDFQRVEPLSKLRSGVRGWTLDVLTTVRGLGKQEFSLDDVYAFASELGALHPQNRNVRPKIRQQLQVLRDLGFLRFLQPGQYALVGRP